MGEVSSATQATQGLYSPAYEHDSCGVAFVATLRGTPGRDIVDLGLTALKNLEHRGAVGAETETGDGAGILTQIPDAFFRAELDFDLPAAGFYAAGIAFLTPGAEAQQMQVFEAAARHEGVDVLGWRDLPVDATPVGPSARATMPTMRQVVVACDGLRGLSLDRRVYRVRKRAQRGGGP